MNMMNNTNNESNLKLKRFVNIRAKNNPRLPHTKNLIRENLIQKILGNKPKKLIYISAPAGYGKSTLMTQYYSTIANSQKSVWLTLDDLDNDLDTFISNLAYAWYGIEDVNYKNDILEDILNTSMKFSIFFDDFENITDKLVLNFLKQLIDYLPTNGEIIIASRSKHPFKTSTLDIDNHLLDIDLNDLAFSKNEIRDFIYSYYSVELNPSQIEAIKNKTEGWIIALHLLGHTLQKNSATSDVIKLYSTNHNRLNQFISEEILSELNQEEEDFIYKISVLKSLNVESCNSLLNIDNSEEYLNNLVSKNIFLTKVDFSNNEYVFHNLFIEYIRNKFEKNNVSLFRSLNLKAANRSLDQHDFNSAIEHFIDAQNYAKAIDLLLHNSTELLKKGRVRFLVRCIEKIPKDIFLTVYKIQFIYAFALILNHRFEEAKSILEIISKQKKINSDDYKILYCLWLSMTDNFEKGYEMCIKTYNPNKSYTSLLDNLFISIYSHYLISKNEIKFARELMNNVIRNSKSISKTFVHTIHEYNESCIDLFYGRIEQAYTRLHSNYFCTWRDNENTVPGGKPMIGTLYAEVLYEKNLLQESIKVAKNSLPYARKNGHIDSLISSYTIISKLEYRVSNNINKSLYYLKELEYLGIDYDSERIRMTALLEQSKLYYLNGDYDLCEKVLDSISNSDIWEKIQHFNLPAQNNENYKLMRLRLNIFHGDIFTNTNFINELISLTSTTDNFKLKIKLKLILSSYFIVKGDMRKSFNYFSSALVECSSERHYSTFLDEGPIVHNLIQIFHNNKNEHMSLNISAREFLAELSKNINPAYLDHERFAKKDRRIINLSKRELEILEHTSEGLKNKDIAERMFLAETTVKAHLRRIHVKLDAHSRTEAISIARKNGLLA